MCFWQSPCASISLLQSLCRICDSEALCNLRSMFSRQYGFGWVDILAYLYSTVISSKRWNFHAVMLCCHLTTIFDFVEIARWRLRPKKYHKSKSWIIANYNRWLCDHDLFNGLEIGIPEVLTPPTWSCGFLSHVPCRFAVVLEIVVGKGEWSALWERKKRAWFCASGKMIWKSGTFRFSQERWNIF